MTPSLKDFNHGEKFQVMIFVSSLCQDYFSRKKSYGVSLARLRDLFAKNVIYGIGKSICFNTNIAFDIKMMKDKSFGKSFSQTIKS